MSDDEFSCLVDNGNRFFGSDWNSNDFITFTLEQLKAIVLFLDLNSKYGTDDISFTDYFYLPDDRLSLLDYIVKLTDWDSQGLIQLSEWKCDFEKFSTLKAKPNPTFGGNTAISQNYAVVGVYDPGELYVYELKRRKLGNDGRYKSA